MEGGHRRQSGGCRKGTGRWRESEPVAAMSDDIEDEKIGNGFTSDELATLRTMLAADRTLMAWIRTSLSLESFGFTIYKVLQGFAAEGKAIATNAPRNAGLVLACAGTLAMLMGLLENRQIRKMVHIPPKLRRSRMTSIMAVVMVLTGIILFVSISAHLL